MEPSCNFETIILWLVNITIILTYFKSSKFFIVNKLVNLTEINVVLLFCVLRLFARGRQPYDRFTACLADHYI